MKKYANAKDVLPRKLLEELQAHFIGILYVPGERTNEPSKRPIIISLAQQGAQTKEIASLMEISTRRVNQILAGKRTRRVEMAWSGEKGK